MGIILLIHASAFGQDAGVRVPDSPEDLQAMSLQLSASSIEDRVAACNALAKAAPTHPDVARLMKVVGDKAVPALIEARRSPSRETRRWAFNLLEDMKRRLPGDAVQTKSQEVLAGVLHAFAHVHDAEAVAVVLAFANSEHALVREAARSSIAEYEQTALPKLRETYSNLIGESPPDDWKATRVAKELFDAFDRYRLHDMYAILEAGIQKQKTGDYDGAVGEFDKVLAQEPLIGRRGEMVTSYLEAGRRAADPVLARRLLEKGLRLDPEGPSAPLFRSELLVLEAQSLKARGILDPVSLNEAIRLNPANARAKQMLVDIQPKKKEPTLMDGRWGIAGGIAALAALIIAVATFRSKRAK